MEAHALARCLREAGALCVRAETEVSAALRSARGHGDGEVLICGSVYLLGDVLNVVGVDEKYFNLSAQ